MIFLSSWFPFPKVSTSFDVVRRLLSLRRGCAHLHRYHLMLVHCGLSGLRPNQAIENKKGKKGMEDAYRRYSDKVTRTGKGTAIVWFRNDLRLLDNECLHRAYVASESILPVYCIDPRQFATTHYFGFPKTGELRAQFLLEGLADLKSNLQNRGLDLFIEMGKPEKILPKLAELSGAHTVFAQRETCSEEILVEKLVRKNLEKVSFHSSKFSADGETEGTKRQHPRLELVWGITMYHLNDLPLKPILLPVVYTNFRKAVETCSHVRPCLKMPFSLAPAPQFFVDGGIAWGVLPSLEELGLQRRDQSPLGAMKFIGGERATIERLYDYFWNKDKLRVYKETRNGMLGADYSTKFSPGLALGFISPRFIYEEVKRYEKERVSNDSTYWVLFELIWRDYFRFVSLKYGNAIFHLDGPRSIKGLRWSQDKELFECWRTGTTGYPLIDANMKELIATGFMSNRGRQIVCSFLVRDLGIDWRMGAEWFESCLLDYDPCSNYGNWTYGAGVGNDPREDRYFSIPKQAEKYDPDGDYVAHWIPELVRLPKFQRHAPGQAYLKPVVPLKHPNIGRTQNSRQQSNKLDFSKLGSTNNGRPW